MSSDQRLVPPLHDLGGERVIACKICTDEYPAAEMYSLERCGCLYCRQCLKQYIVLLVDEAMAGKGIGCPDAFCKVRINQLSDQEVLWLTDAGYHARYLQQKEELEVAVDPERAWCPAPRCGSVCAVRDGHTHCSQCHLQFCSRCQVAWEDTHHCSATNSTVLMMEEEAGTGGDFKRCPRCEVLIERDMGCAQILCQHCHHVFCWHCLQSLEDDLFLHHYDQGPCQGRLGHSRPRLHLYRLQVVCFLVGFVMAALLLFPCIILLLPFYYCFCWRKCSRPSATTTTATTATGTTPTVI